MSQDIRNEREDLREAAEQTINVIVDLNLDGTVKWVSPSWTEVIGTELDTVSGIPMSDLIVSENKTVFTDVVESMKKDDSKSHRIRFAIQLGPLSKLRSEADDTNDPDAEEPQTQVADLEAQGIMVYDSASGGESHVSIDRCHLLFPVLTQRAGYVDDSSVDRAIRGPDRPSRCHY